MQLTKKDIDLIETAEKSLRRAKLRRLLLFAILVASVVLTYFGFLDPKEFALVAVACVLISSFFDSSGANSERIVELLIRVRSESEAPTTSPLIESLSNKS